VLRSQVAEDIPRVEWGPAAEALQACVDAMPRGAPAVPRVVEFAQKSLFGILDIMLSLNNISALNGLPKKYHFLQGCFGRNSDLFDRNFACTISNSLR